METVTGERGSDVLRTPDTEYEPLSAILCRLETLNEFAGKPYNALLH